MCSQIKLVLAGLTATAALAALVGTASANHLSITETRFKMTFSPLTYEEGFGIPIRCNATMEGSFVGRTISKTLGSRIGSITGATMGTCEPSEGARFDTETLPWEVQYESFEGILPGITKWINKAINAAYEIKGALIGLASNCTYKINTGNISFAREPRGIIATATIAWSAPSVTLSCPTGSLSGVASVHTPTGGNIVVTLI